MSDQLRKVEQYSPKSSPRGSRSPVVPRQDSSGTLKTTISLLGKNPQIVPVGPFYLVNERAPQPQSELTGATNLMAHYGLEHSYNKSSGKRVRDTLSSFLPLLPGYIDSPGQMDGSSLRSVIDKPPVCGKELLPLNQLQLTGFRLHPGPLPEQFRSMYLSPQKKKHKHKKHKHKAGETPSHQESSAAELAAAAEKKHKKQKRHEDDKERKKRKKEKKKKKQKHSPEHPSSSGSSTQMVSSGMSMLKNIVD